MARGLVNSAEHRRFDGVEIDVNVRLELGE